MQLYNHPPTFFHDSRQRYVLGDNAMHRMAGSRVFLYGLGGLGVEIGELVCSFYQYILILHCMVIANCSKEHCISWSEGIYALSDY